MKTMLSKSMILFVFTCSFGCDSGAKDGVKEEAPRGGIQPKTGACSGTLPTPSGAHAPADSVQLLALPVFDVEGYKAAAAGMLFIAETKKGYAGKEYAMVTYMQTMQGPAALVPAAGAAAALDVYEANEELLGRTTSRVKVKIGAEELDAVRYGQNAIHGVKVLVPVFGGSHYSAVVIEAMSSQLGCAEQAGGLLDATLAGLGRNATSTYEADEKILELKN